MSFSDFFEIHFNPDVQNMKDIENKGGTRASYETISLTPSNSQNWKDDILKIEYYFYQFSYSCQN